MGLFLQLFNERADQSIIDKAESIIGDYINRIESNLSKVIDYIRQYDGDIYRLKEDRDFKQIVDLFHKSLNKLSDDITLEILARYEGASKGAYAEYKYGKILVYADDLHTTRMELNLILGDSVEELINEYIKYFEKYVNTLKSEKVKASLIHELVHYLDDKNIKRKTRGKENLFTTASNRVSPKLKKSLMKDEKFDTNALFNDYVNRTWEVNAHLIQKLFKHRDLDSVNDFINAVKANESDFEWYSNLNEKNKRKVLKRIYDHYNN